MSSIRCRLCSGNWRRRCVGKKKNVSGTIKTEMERNGNKRKSNNLSLNAKRNTFRFSWTQFDVDHNILVTVVDISIRFHWNLSNGIRFISEINQIERVGTNTIISYSVATQRKKKTNKPIAGPWENWMLFHRHIFSFWCFARNLMLRLWAFSPWNDAYVSRQF